MCIDALFCLGVCALNLLFCLGVRALNHLTLFITIPRKKDQILFHNTKNTFRRCITGLHYKNREWNVLNHIEFQYKCSKASKIKMCYFNTYVTFQNRHEKFVTGFLVPYTTYTHVCMPIQKNYDRTNYETN